MKTEPEDIVRLRTGGALEACLCKVMKSGTLCLLYATETYFTHFLEEARFPKAPVLARRKVFFILVFQVRGKEEDIIKRCTW